MKRIYTAAFAVAVMACDGSATVSTPDASAAVHAPAASTTAAPTTTSPIPSAPWVTFTSQRHGYSIDHPADWLVVEHPGRPHAVGQRLDSPGTDTLGPRDVLAYGGDDGVISIAAHGVEAGDSLTHFTDRFSRGAACGGLGFSRSEAELGGEAAQSRKFSCAGWNWVQLTALHHRRGYVVWLVGTQPPAPEDRPLFDLLLATFRFTD